MDIDEYKKMQADTEAYRNTLENVSIEKIVIDRKYARLWQESVAFEKECLKKDTEITVLKNEIEKLKEEISGLKSKMVGSEIAELLEPDAVESVS